MAEGSPTRSPTRQRKMSEERKAARMAMTIHNYKRGRRSTSISSPKEGQVCTDAHGFTYPANNNVIKIIRESQVTNCELRRNSKWLKMIVGWKDYIRTPKFAERIYKGIPDSVRGYVWAQLLNVPASLKDNQGFYKIMKDNFGLGAKPHLIETIDADVKRTFKRHWRFTGDYGTKQQQLFYILATYSTYNTQLGYTQGMSEMVAMFLLYMGEEEAFWAFSSFISGSLSMHGFLIHPFPKLKRFQAHHEAVLKKMIPKVYNHLKKWDITDFYTIKWFMLAYHRLPFSLCVRIWDVYLLKGEEVLVGMAYTIVKKLEKEILQNTDESLIYFFQRIEKHSIFNPDHEDEMISSLKKNIYELTRYKLHLPPPATDFSEHLNYRPPSGDNREVLPRQQPQQQPQESVGSGFLSSIRRKFTKGDGKKNTTTFNI